MERRNDQDFTFQGFVVNIHNSINFDIDVTIPEKLNFRYRKASRQFYDYNLIDEQDFIYGPNLGEKPVITGSAYRCRLRGISFNSHYKKINDHEMITAIGHLLNLTDRYVEVTLEEVDSYNRILVDIWVGSTNLREKIFQWDKHQHYLRHPF